MLDTEVSRLCNEGESSLFQVRKHVEDLLQCTERESSESGSESEFEGSVERVLLLSDDVTP